MAKKTYRVHLRYNRRQSVDVRAEDMTDAYNEAAKLRDHLNETPGDGEWEVRDVYEVPDAK